MRSFTRFFAAAMLFATTPVFAGDYTIGNLEIEMAVVPPGAPAPVQTDEQGGRK
ncbi:hypothetical protein [Nitratireductor soli]|uniref:hypothetical protein n=1 Tax=Nitratireductor soli TaxID=1670619 RepID=UPI000AFD6E05|nr:hypothetical protein [Nitratireductor soli]